MKYLKYFLGAFFFLSFLAWGQTPEEKGLEIAKKVRDANQGFLGEKASMKMVLIDAYGSKTERDMEGKVLEMSKDGDKSLSLFLNPLDVKGTKMITWSHKDDDDDQWLYLPSMKRVKRISSSGKSASFMGSEFSFEDLGSQELEKFTYKWLRDEKLEGEEIWVLERIPNKKSGYTKQVIYMSKSKMNPLKMEYFDRKGELLKVAQFQAYKLYKLGNKEIWKSNQIEMKNVQTKKESIFIWKDRVLGVTLKESEFDAHSL